MSFVAGEIALDWYKLERGIITGCIISVILFTLTVNMWLSAEVECQIPMTRTGIHQPPIRAYMDDLTMLTSSIQGCKWILQGLINSFHG